MPKASAMRPGPLVSRGRSRGLCTAMMSSSRHLLNALKRFDRAEKHSPGLPIALARNVQAIVIAVDEVDVGVTGWAEQNCSAGGIAGERSGTRDRFSRDKLRPRRCGLPGGAFRFPRPALCREARERRSADRVRRMRGQAGERGILPAVRRPPAAVPGRLRGAVPTAATPHPSPILSGKPALLPHALPLSLWEKCAGSFRLAR